MASRAQLPLLALLLATCAGPPDPVYLHGAAQKGPFILGSSVTAAPLDGQGAPTGLQFEAAAANDLGEFTMLDVPPGPVALLATGFHFDEVRGGRSLAPITLRALHLATADTTTINIHVLTHLSEPRARALFTNGTPLAEALAEAEAEAELVAALEIGPPGLTLAASAAEANLLGPDDPDNAYLLAVSAVLAQAAHLADHDAPDAALQELLNRLAADLADDGKLDPALVTQLAAAETELDAGLVRTHLADRAVELGLPGQVPDLRRALDQDHDGLANHLDNCPHHLNFAQADEDGDGIGDPCDECQQSPGDGDGDGVQDKCDNCPDVPNPLQNAPEGYKHPDPDGDGLGNECDACPLSNKTGGVPDENCCDPREGDCTRWTQWSTTLHQCYPDPDGLRFACALDHLCGDNTYGRETLGCGGPAITVPPAGLPGCEDHACITRWCTVGDTSCDKLPGATCIPWYHPGEAPPGLDALGLCALADAGPCAGKPGRECAVWDTD